MKLTLGQYILKRVRELGYRSLMRFYEEASFSFSYEYLRQITLDRRVPSPSKVEELAKALKAKRSEVIELATSYKLSEMTDRYYGKGGATSSAPLVDKTGAYQEQGKVQAKLEDKILRIFRMLPPERQEQAVDFLKFLRLQWRKNTD